MRAFHGAVYLSSPPIIAAIMALDASSTAAFAQSLAKARRQSVIWLSFQECTGCTESITRSFSPTLEDLIFNFISLDYSEALMNASGFAAEEARKTAMLENKGKYVLVVEGAIPLKDEAYSVSGWGIASANPKRCRQRRNGNYRGWHLRLVWWDTCSKTQSNWRGWG